jgi:hypothetical protein
MSDFEATLEEAVRATRVERYRWLCSEANTLPMPNSREDWRRFILERRWIPSEMPAAAIDTGVGWVPPPSPCGGC